MNIKLQIDRLVLDGVPLGAGGSEALRASVEEELSRLFATGGLTPALMQGGALHSLRAGAIQLTGEGPSQMGKQLAHALYSGLGTPQGK